MNTQDIQERADKLGISADVYLFLRQSSRKMRYFTCDLKRERIIIDGEQVAFIPSREDSFDRLLEEGINFASEEKSVEDIVIDDILHQNLRDALDRLDEGEQQLIDEIFYQGTSEEKIAQSLGITQQAVSKQKKKVLAKIRSLIKY